MSGVSTECTGISGQRVERGIPGSDHVGLRTNERADEQSERGAENGTRRAAGTNWHLEPRHLLCPGPGARRLRCSPDQEGSNACASPANRSGVQRLRCARRRVKRRSGKVCDTSHGGTTYVTAPRPSSRRCRAWRCRPCRRRGWSTPCRPGPSPAGRSASSRPAASSSRRRSRRSRGPCRLRAECGSSAASSATLSPLSPALVPPLLTRYWNERPCPRRDTSCRDASSAATDSRTIRPTLLHTLPFVMLVDARRQRRRRRSAGDTRTGTRRPCPRCPRPSR